MSDVIKLEKSRANKLRLEEDTSYLFLDEDTDYLYCPVCRVHVPCRRLECGGWEVHCRGCLGECVNCTCYLKQFCFGSREQFPSFEKVSGREKD